MGLNFRGLKSPFLHIYGLYAPAGVTIRRCMIPDVGMKGRGLACPIHVDRCEFDNIGVIGWNESSIPFLSINGLRVAHSCSVSYLQGLWIKETSIGGDFTIQDLGNDATMTFSSVEINGALSISLGPNAGRIRLKFDHVDAYRYEDRAQDLQAIARLEVEGLVYQELVDWGTNEAKKRIAWLAKQPQDPFPLGSWRRVGAQLRRRGLFPDARRLLIESERRRRDALHQSPSAHFWSWLLRTSIGYGWELWRIGWLALLLVLIGTVVAWIGIERALLVKATAKGPDVAFNPIVYSIDEALPIIDLRHGSLWLPTGKGWDGQAVQIYFWFHIVFGWAIATLFVLGLSGAARKGDEG